MKSDFEKHAAQAAVDAVEARWRRNHENERRQFRRKKLGSLGAVFMLALIFGGGVLAWMWWNGSAPEGVMRLGDGIAARYRQITGAQPPAPPQPADNPFVMSMRRLLSLPVALLADLPPQENPKKAPKGKTFSAVSLSPDKAPRFYRLTANGKGGLDAVECTLSGERAITWDTFTFKCRKPYLLQVGKCAYLCGSKDVADAQRRKSRVLSGLAPAPQK